MPLIRNGQILTSQIPAVLVLRKILNSCRSPRAPEMKDVSSYSGVHAEEEKCLIVFSKLGHLSCVSFYMPCITELFINFGIDYIV